MHRFCLALARLAASLWVGAALLFVVTSVAEQVYPGFDIKTKNTLALIRFPWYYGAGFSLLAVAILATRFARPASRMKMTATAFLLAALGLMSVDYTFVYRPIRATLAEHGAERDAAFQQLHTWSEGLNSVGFLFAFSAAVMLCAATPVPDEPGEK